MIKTNAKLPPPIPEEGQTVHILIDHIPFECIIVRIIDANRFLIVPKNIEDENAEELLIVKKAGHWTHTRSRVITETYPVLLGDKSSD